MRRVENVTPQSLEYPSIFGKDNSVGNAMVNDQFW